MSSWHPVFEAYEVFGSRRKTQTDKDVRMTVTLLVDSTVVDRFVDDLLLERYPFPWWPDTGTGSTSYDDLDPSYACLRPISIDVVNDAGKYDASVDTEIIYPLNHRYVTVTYGVDTRMEVELFGQTVLIDEVVKPHVEWLTMDYTQFKWDDDEPLRSSDESPGMMFKSYKISLTIERLDLSLGSVFDSLIDMNSTVNVNPVLFYSFNKVFPAETVLCQIELIERYMETECHAYEGTGTDVWDIGDYWSRVVLSFSCHVPMAANTLQERTPTWNKYYRAYYDVGPDTGTSTDDVDKSGWFEIKHIKKPDGGGNTTFKVYPISEAMDVVLRNVP